MVVMVRPYQSSHGGVCGIAWVGGNNTQGDFSNSLWAETAMSVVGLDGPCGDWVTAHELGHNMGLTHSSHQDSRGGTYPWAWGYAQDNDFATMMSYAWLHGNQTRKVYNFSSPELDCYGSPCGISWQEPDGADAVHALTQVAPQIALYKESVIDNPKDDDGEGDGDGVSTPPETNPDELKAVWQQEKATLQEYKAQLKAVKADFKSTKAEYKTAKKAYDKAFRAYEKSVNKLDKLLTKANQAIEKYNQSSDLSEAKQQRLYEKAMAAVEKYNTQVDVVNTLADTVNQLVPAYAQAIEAFELITESLNEAKALVTSQKAVVKAAYEAYIAAKNG